MDIRTKVIQALAARRGADPAAITDATRFTDLSLDSLDVAELVMDLEDSLGVTIDISQVQGTVGDLLRVIGEAGK
ncbi:MAG: phosphopantetheine-binding protein [Christensenellales bacterium]